MRPPGDKSVSHRALILNAIANGTAKVTGLSDGEDVLSTMRCLTSLKVRIEPGGDKGTVTVHGIQGRLEEPSDILDAGNSGTSMRLLSGLLASQSFLSVVTGDNSLRSRPMSRIVQPLKLMGAQILGRNGDTLAPLVIRGGSLNGIEYMMPVPSAQVKSSIILAGLFAQGETVLHQPAPSRDHTERIVRAMGGDVREDGLSLVLKPGKLSAVDVAVPGDISAAAFWMVAALCHPDARVTIRGVGVNPTRGGITETLEAMGARISRENIRLEGGEPVADLVVESSDLSAVEVGGELIPRIIDELPALAVAACFARGTTVIRDAQELRVKGVRPHPDHGTGTVTARRQRRRTAGRHGYSWDRASYRAGGAAATTTIDWLWPWEWPGCWQMVKRRWMTLRPPVYPTHSSGRT